MARLSVRVTPRASRDAVEGFDADGTLRVRVTAAPADGAANAAVAKLLARALDLPGRDIVLVSGATARQKVFEIPIELAEARAPFSLLPLFSGRTCNKRVFCHLAEKPPLSISCKGRIGRRIKPGRTRIEPA